MAAVRESRLDNDLEVWQVSLELVKAGDQNTATFPSSERLGLTQQISRAAISLPFPVAEGQFRNSPKELKRFCSMAVGPAAELETSLIIARERE